MEVMAAQRGTAVPDRAAFDREVDQGALVVGSPETVARKIVECARLLGLSRFDLKYDLGGTTARDRAQTVELLGTAVRPRVDELLATDEDADPDSDPDPLTDGGRSTGTPAAPVDPRRGPGAIFGGRTDALGAKRDVHRR